jgi:hypothetical protein
MEQLELRNLEKMLKLKKLLDSKELIYPKLKYKDMEDLKEVLYRLLLQHLLLQEIE